MKKISNFISTIHDLELFLFNEELVKELKNKELFFYLYDNISISKTALFQIYLLCSHINFFKEELL